MRAHNEDAFLMQLVALRDDVLFAGRCAHSITVAPVFMNCAGTRSKPTESRESLTAATPSKKPPTDLSFSSSFPEALPNSKTPSACTAHWPPGTNTFAGTRGHDRAPSQRRRLCRSG